MAIVIVIVVAIACMVVATWLFGSVLNRGADSLDSRVHERERDRFVERFLQNVDTPEAEAPEQRMAVGGADADISADSPPGPTSVDRTCTRRGCGPRGEGELVRALSCAYAHVLASWFVAHEEFAAAGELLSVLSAPVRLAIILRLAEGPAAVHRLADGLDEPQPLISQHLRILRSARLIRASVRGRERIYELVDDHVAHIARDAVRHTTEPQTTIEEKTS